MGGGAAGWITAASLAAGAAARTSGRTRIELVSSPDTPRIGVGEATIPTVRNMLRRLGLRERDVMASCEATFKHGIRFDDWNGPGSSYLHPFQRVFAPDTGRTVANWLEGDGTPPFADLVSVQGALIDGSRAPRAKGDPEYGTAELPYAYHLDAEMFGDMLSRHAVERGVVHSEGHVTGVERAEDDGRVRAVTLRDGRRLSADLFVDCTGFQSLLADGAEGDDHWIDQSQHLLCDRAVTLRVPYGGAVPVLAPFTRARALDAGWAWDIGLMSRRGRGYVYSSRHLSPEAAEAELRCEEGPGATDLPTRHIAFRVGRLARPWRRNVVSIGLAAGFVEPLESTGIYLIDFAARSLLETFPPGAAHAASAELAAVFNARLGEVHDEIVDFIQLHYVLAQRRDTSFWRDASDPARASDRLRQRLSVWSVRPPSFSDFPLRFPPFNQVSYEFVMCGSGWRPSGALAGSRATQCPASTRGLTDHLLQRLPSHAALLQQIRGDAALGTA